MKLGGIIFMKKQKQKILKKCYMKGMITKGTNLQLNKKVGLLMKKKRMK